MKNLKYIFFAFFVFGNLYSQDTLNEFLPQSLGANVNGSEHELNPVLTPDGKTLYFSREEAVPDKYWHERPQNIYETKLQNDGTWGKAKKLPENVNAGLYNGAVGTSPKGDTLYINGVFSKKNRWYKRGLSYVVKIDSNHWSKPKRIKVRGLSRMNKGRQSNMRLTNEGKYLFISMSKRSNGKKNNLYRAERNDNGGYGKPKKLKSPIKHPKADEAPFVSADGRTLYFATNRYASEGKGMQIVKSTLIDDSYLMWTEPVKLSDTVNSQLWDSYYITNLSGSCAYFCSHYKATGGSDIFRVKIFEENPFILVKGKILTKKNGEEVVPEAGMKVLVDDKVIDTLKIDDKGNFELRLPLGAKYTLRAEAKNQTSDGVEVVDVTAVKAYRETQKTLYVKPSDALVYGKLTSTEGRPFDPEKEPKLYVNGKELNDETAKELGIETYEVDFKKAKYSARLPLHKKYDLEIRVKDNNPVPATVDLSKVDEYKEISKDLFAAPIPKVVAEQKVAVFSGKVLNKKTSKPITGNTDLKIQVDEADFYAARIDTSKGSYEFELPLGKKYVINAKAPNFYPEYEQIDLSAEKGKVKIIKDLLLSPIEKGQSIKLKNIFFDFGKSTLKKESFPELDKLYKFLTENPDIKVEIAGHTDNKGAAEKNMQLSRWRARSVQQYLVQKGIAIKRVSFNGYGLDKPVASNKTEAGRALNRRVEFTILEH